MVLQISVLFFEEGSEEIDHGDALGDSLEFDRSVEGFRDVEGESFHFDVFDWGWVEGEFRRKFLGGVGWINPFLKLGLLGFGREGDFFAGGFARGFGGRSSEGFAERHEGR